VHVPALLLGRQVVDPLLLFFREREKRMKR